MTAFVDDLAEMLAQDGDRYYTGELASMAITFIADEILAETRWSIYKLDVYRRESDGAVAGVTWEKPSTEFQDGAPRNPTAVNVVADTRVVYKVAK